MASLKGRGLYSPQENTFRTVGQRIDGLDLIASTSQYLGRTSGAREKLLRVARISAYSSISVSQACAESNIARRSIYRYAWRVADGLNTDRRRLIASLVPDTEPPAEGNMDYRAYFVGDGGRFVDAHDIEAESDVEAIALAFEFFTVRPIELWCGDRFVHRFGVLPVAQLASEIPLRDSEGSWRSQAKTA
jgi:hypothetical protein